MNSCLTSIFATAGDLRFFNRCFGPFGKMVYDCQYVFVSVARLRMIARDVYRDALPRFADQHRLQPCLSQRSSPEILRATIALPSLSLHSSHQFDPEHPSPQLRLSSCDAKVITVMSPCVSCISALQYFMDGIHCHATCSPSTVKRIP